MIIGKIIGHNSFDILDLEETQSSLYRSPTMVRLSYKDEENRLIQYTKISEANVPKRGDLLTTFHGLLLPTRDRLNTRTVAKLLANAEDAVETKAVTIGVTTCTAKLLPVEII